MTPIGVYQILFFFALILAITKPLGAFMARVYEGERTFLHPILRPLEVVIYRLERGQISFGKPADIPFTRPQADILQIVPAGSIRGYEDIAEVRITMDRNQVGQ